jgi:hypothetical protein
LALNLDQAQMGMEEALRYHHESALQFAPLVSFEASYPWTFWAAGLQVQVLSERRLAEYCSYRNSDLKRCSLLVFQQGFAAEPVLGMHLGVAADPLNALW